MWALLTGGILLAIAALAVGCLWLAYRAEGRRRQRATRLLQEEVEAGRRAGAELHLRNQELQGLISVIGLLSQPGIFEDKSVPLGEGLARVADAKWITLRPPDDSQGGLRLVEAAEAGMPGMMEERVRELGHLPSIGELAAGVAHGINNPLTSILGYCWLLTSEELSESARANLQTVYTEAQRAAKMVHSLLALARRPQAAWTSLDVNTVLERALELKAHDFQADNINVARNFSKGLSPTMANGPQLLEVVLNILTNAEQAMRGAHRRGRLTVQTASSGHRIRIAISDDGPGIAPEHLNRVFEPFFTTKVAGQGTGLGLSIAYGLVRQHGGDLWAESIPGQGTTFHIDLPVVSPPPEAPPPTSPPASPVEPLLVAGRPG